VSAIGPGLAALSALQAAQAQQSASRARDAEKAREERPRRAEDEVDLRVAGVEGDDAVRAVPDEASEESATERRGRDPRAGRRADDEDERPRVDLVA